MPEKIKLTGAFGRLAGFYLAEGSTDRGRIVWSFNIKEENTFVKEVLKITKDLGLNPKTSKRNNTLKVIVYGSRIAKLFNVLFGQGAKNKRLHRDLTAGPEEFLAGVLSGWIDGDRQRGESGVTISRKLALQMFNIANAQGKLPSLSTHTKEKVDKNGVKHQHAWRVGLNNPETYKRGVAEQTDTHMWRKVVGLIELPYNGDVFNLEVECDHSYTAEGISSHNCWDFSGTGIVEMAMVKAGLGTADKFQLSEQYTLDCGQNGGCGGDDNSNVCEWAKTTGLPLTSDYGPYRGGPSRCKSGVKLWKITDWGYCDQQDGVADTQKIKNCMVQYGPIGAAIAADNAFMNVSPGEVFDGNSSNINHDIILCGWDDSKGAWLLRNSWGDWCDGGYCWIKYGANQVGTSALWVTLPQTVISWYI